ncbi:hypothetical protein EV127DRAFT_512369 [Xylaria flabelliformis]|nr:hypothetical protein EV127DRAFT_512369 [Xylaria flabelliformis]
MSYQPHHAIRALLNQRSDRRAISEDKRVFMTVIEGLVRIISFSCRPIAEYAFVYIAVWVLSLLCNYEHIFRTHKDASSGFLSCYVHVG